MKRTLTSLALLGLLIPGVANAKKQRDPDRLSLEKGTMQLGGSATLDVDMYDGESTMMLNINPTGGYFVANRVELYGSLGFNTMEGSSSWSIGPGLKYFIPMRPMFAYVGGELGYGSSSYSSVDATGEDVEYSYKSWQVQAGGGILIPVGKNMAVDLGGRLGMSKPTGEGMEEAKGTTHIKLGYVGFQAFFK